MATRNRSTTQARDAQAIVGIQDNLQNVTSLPLAGTVYTMPALSALVQSRIDAANAATNARALWLDASAKYKALDSRVIPVVRGLRQYVMNAYGEDSPVLAEFGFAPPKKAALTPDQLVARNAKISATRIARGTKGKKQKLAIHGTVAETAPTSPMTPAAASVPAKPAV